MKKDLEPDLRTMDLDGTVLPYLHYPGDGPPVVLVHATGFFPWLWHPISRSLAGEFEVIAPFFCGHRPADPQDGGLPWGLLARDLTALCDGLALERPFFAGHSMGGTVATLAAAGRPDRVRGMVLIEPIFLPRELYGKRIGVEMHPLASRAVSRRNHWADRAEARDYLREKSLFEPWDPEMFELYLCHGLQPAEGGGLELTCPPQQEAALFMGSMHSDPWPLFSRVGCPVKVVEGEKSFNRGHVDLEKAASTFPRGTFHLFEGVGHMVPMERPRETGRLIQDFFAIQDC